MSAVDVQGTKFTIALIAGRTLRAQCLARFLELSGLSTMIVAPENPGESLLSENGAVDLAIIDTGEQTCRDPDIRTIFTCLRDALPGAPVMVVSDREDWSAVIDALHLGARAYFPSSLDPNILIETLRFVQKGGTFIPLEVLINAPLQRKRAQDAEAGRPEIRGLRRASSASSNSSKGASRTRRSLANWTSRKAR